jgi:Protein of unknown function (DUF433)
MKRSEPHSDSEIMGGTPVFVGTRVRLGTLLDYRRRSEALRHSETDPAVTPPRAQAVGSAILKQIGVWKAVHRSWVAANSPVASGQPVQDVPA